MRVLRKVLGLDVPALEATHRQFPTSVLFHAINGVLWGYLTLNEQKRGAHRTW